MRRLKTGGRALVVVAVALMGAALVALMPVSAHITQDDPGHNWNQHYFDLAKQDFHTKQKANQRFISPCEPGSIAFGARVEDPGALPSTFVEVSSLSGSSGYNCTGAGVFVRRDGVGEFTWRVPLGLVLGNVVTSITAGGGQGDDEIVLGYTGTTTVSEGVLLVQTRVFELSDDGSGATMTDVDPPVMGLLGNFLDVGN